MKTYLLLLPAIALLLFSATAARANSAIAFMKGNPRMSIFIATGYGSQQEADDAAMKGCNAYLAKKYSGGRIPQCDSIVRPPDHGYGAVACHNAAHCYFGHADTGEAAREQALTACRTDSIYTDYIRSKCDIGNPNGQGPLEIAGVWLDDPKRHSLPGDEPSLHTSSSKAQPAGSLKLLCQLNTGNAYVFVIDEAKQVVAVRDSAGTQWETFRNGQTLRQRLGNQWINMIDVVRVDAGSIRAVRAPQDEESKRAPNVSNNQSTNELAGLLGDLLTLTSTASSVAIDRNSGSIRTGGVVLFPNNAVGTCEPWTGRRF